MHVNEYAISTTKWDTPVYKDVAESTHWNLKIFLCSHLSLPPTLQHIFGMPVASLWQSRGQNIDPGDYAFPSQDEILFLGD